MNEQPLAPALDASRTRLDRLIQKLRGERAASPPDTIARRSDVENPPPASYAQRRLWFLDRLEPHSSAYNVPGRLRLVGPCDLRALAGALARVVERHEVLRTTFAEVDGEPVQVIHAFSPPGLPRIDLSRLDLEQGRAELGRLSRDATRRPFDLAAGPLLRAELIELGPEERMLLLVMHHTVSDGWSLGLLLGEIAQLYREFSGGEKAELPDLRLQYADWSVWQRGRLEGESWHRLLEYWGGRLDGLPALELPVKASQNAPRRVGVCGFALSEAATRAFRHLARSRETTLFAALLAGFGTFLTRITGQSDFALGTAIAGRNRRELEPLIGFFANTLVLRLDVSGPSFEDVLAAARETVLGAEAHQEAPFERLVEALSPVRRSGEMPFFRVALVLEADTLEPRSAEGLWIEPEKLRPGQAKFDLLLTVRDREAGDRLGGEIEYRADLFDGAVVEFWSRSLARLLGAAAEAPERGLGELPILTRAQRRRILEAGTRRADHPVAGRLDALFAAVASERPDSVAVSAGDRRLSYGELERRSACLARELHDLGARPETLVGLCLERSPELLVGILGILRSGAAYLPLDPAHPAQRRRHALEDSGTRWVVTERALAEELPAGVEKLFLDDLANGTALALPSAGSPENLAYAIYTSGSTGRPKGTPITHRNVVRLFSAAEEVYDFGPDDVWSLFHSYAFDFSVWEIWGAWLHGGRVAVVPSSTTRDPETFATLLENERVSVLDQTPSAFRQLPVRVYTSLRWVIFGGEALDPRILQPFFELGGCRARFVNMYGITETTVHVTHRELSPGDTEGSPIGRPLDDLGLYLLDRWGQPVPLGVVGEIHVAGAGLGRGYLGRPALSAERFIPDGFSVPDAFSGSKGARLYRSGDLGRRTPTGELEYLGRIDHQVQIRGFRVELGEVEAALEAQEGVAEAVVLARELGPGDPRLQAWVVPEDDSTLHPRSLRRALAERLPEAMMPAAIALLESLPLTVNGKLDREALFESAPEIAEGDDSPPRSTLEELLAQLFAEVLAVDSVGRDQDFFELGGHSLLATRLISRLRSRLGVELPLAAFFDAPTVADLGRALAERRLERSGLPALERIDRGGPLPASFSQERVWFLQRLDPTSAAYNMPGRIHLRGPLDPAALAWALGELAARHEVLRTRLVEEGGEPVQIVDERTDVVLPVVDLSEADTAEADRLARHLAARPFDLETEILWRPVLLAAGAEDHTLVLVMHHAISDGWSMGVLAREVGELYSSRVEGREPALAELGLQYADWAAWQRSWLQGETLEEQLGYWRETLAGVPVHELPADRPRRTVSRRPGAALPVRLEKSRQIAELARREGATPFMVLLAAWQVYLGRLAGQRDLAVGTPVAGRRRLELEPLIGFFVNTLAIRGEHGPDSSFRDHLARVRERMLEADLRQDLPFERLVEELAPERHLETTPLFQTLLVLQNTPRPSPRLSGLEVDWEEIPSGAAKFELSLALTESPEGLVGLLEYRRDLFDETTVRRWWGHFERLLDAAVTDAGQRLDRLSWLAPEERHQLVVEWNDAPPAARKGEDFLALFEARVAERGEATAIVFGDLHLSYGELSNRSRRLARALLRRGVGPETLVGVSLERSADFAVAALGVLSAGGAWLPLDPRYPAARLELMLDDARPSLVLVHGATRLVLEATALPPGLELVELETLLAKEAGTAGAEAAIPDQLAYAIYTSGSTGKPKGALLTRRGLSNLTRAQARLFGVRPGERVLQFASPSFDASVSELAVTLEAGATLVLAPREALMPGDPLRATLGRGITSVTLPPTALAALGEGASRELGSLGTIVVAGEACPPDLARRFGRARRFINAYGPTEATVCATAQPWRGGEELPVGRPIAGMAVTVVDRTLEPVPTGVAGEIAIGGAGVGRGYLHRPALTAERFVPDPFSGIAGARLYRSGDLGRRLVGGEVEFLGRIDHQIKIRGVRIELGEIEAALTEIRGVEQAVVLAREAAPGDLRLAAWWIPVEGGEPVAAELWAALAQRLPEAMVPAAFTALDAFPSTPNGKIDRSALARSEIAWGASRGEQVAPRNPAEELVAGAFAELLNVEAVGVHDDFFALGGHSLLATRLVSRLRKILGVEIELRRVFEAPTVAQIAARVESASSEAPELSPIAVQPRPPGEARFPLSFAQERLWILDRLEPGNTAYNIPMAVEFRGELEWGHLAGSFQALIARHEALRTTFVREGDRPLQVIHERAAFSLPAVDLGRLEPGCRGRELERALAREAATPFSLERGPLLRALLLSWEGPPRRPTASRLVLDLHHAVADGWSAGVMMREIAVCYRASLAGETAVLPRLPVQYADWAVWQRRFLEGAELERQVGYWRERLAGLPPALDLPTDRPRPAVRSFRGGRVHGSIDPALTAALQALARRSGVTLFAVLLTAFKLLVARHAGADDLAVGTPIAGRRRAEAEGLVGIFLNTLVLRTELDSAEGDGPTFSELLARIWETARGAYAHQDVPFERLLDELRPERDLSRTPLFQVFFNMLNLPLETADLGPARLEPVAMPDAPAKFEITLYARESGRGIELDWVYNAELFKPERMAELAAQYRLVLEQAVASPERPVGALSLVTEDARPRLGQPTAALDATWRGSVVELFARRAREHPERIAVEDARETWRYGELRDAVHRLGHRLRSSGVERGSAVTIWAWRTAELPWAILGAIEAGGAFAMLDPAYPAERLLAMLETCRPRAFVEVAGAPEVPEVVSAWLAAEGCGRVSLPAGPAAAAAAFRNEPAGSVGLELGPDDAAAIGFTSGSTGRPKGIVGRHGPLSFFLPFMIERFGLSADDRFALLSGLGHDPLQRDVFTPLALGASLAVPEPGAMLASGYLAGWLREREVSVVHLTPALGQVIAEVTEETPRVGSLRLAFLVGDVLRRRDVERLQCLAPKVVCVNLYGSTETQRSVAFHEASGSGEGKEILPLGRGMPGVELLVVNGAGELAGVGELGEIQVRSPHLARGYLGLEKLDRERFVTNPWTREPGDRLYRTGDLGRYLPSGEVVFAGRSDLQVQVRGYRVELGEIEGALVRLGGVAEAAVVAVESPGGVELVGFAVAEEGSAPGTAELRAALSKRLPGYMVPARILEIEALPLTANRKLDRARLVRRAREARELASGEGGRGYRPPKTEMERGVARLLQEVLAVERVGVDDNFFDLGGNSLLLVQLHGRLQESLGRELTPMEIFNHPTVGALAARLEGSPRAAAPVDDRESQLRAGRARLRQRRGRARDRVVSRR